MYIIKLLEVLEEALEDKSFLIRKYRILVLGKSIFGSILLFSPIFVLDSVSLFVKFLTFGVLGSIMIEFIFILLSYWKAHYLLVYILFLKEYQIDKKFSKRIHFFGFFCYFLFVFSIFDLFSAISILILVSFMKGFIARRMNLSDLEKKFEKAINYIIRCKKKEYKY